MSPSRLRHLLAFAFLSAACSQAPPRPKALASKAIVTKQEPTPPKGLSGTIAALETFLKREGLPPAIRAQAMFRLAAHYEDQARADAEASGKPPDLSRSIELYESILQDFPQQPESAAIHYFLGHALSDMGRYAEAQSVFRSLVCHNHYPYNKSSLGSAHLPQDHDVAYWTVWETDKNRTETKFSNPYPDDCQPLAAQSDPGKEPRFIAEAWWKIGEFHFDQLNDRAGPFALNRAAVAYTRATRAENKLVRPIAMYKLAWTHYRQQRYEAAVLRFLDLLHYLEQQKGQGAELRAEAITYIASSLTFVDFQGPGVDDPFVPRDDVLDTERDPAVAERKMRIAITRVENPNIIPQSESFTPDIYEALAVEFRELSQLNNEIDVIERLLQRWPQYRNADALRTRLEVAKRARPTALRTRRPQAFNRLRIALAKR